MKKEKMFKYGSDIPKCFMLSSILCFNLVSVWFFGQKFLHYNVLKIVEWYEFNVHFSYFIFFCTHFFRVIFIFGWTFFFCIFLFNAKFFHQILFYVFFIIYLRLKKIVVKIFVIKTFIDKFFLMYCNGDE